MKEDRLLTRKEVAKLLRISYSTVIRWEKQGILNPVRLRGTRDVKFWESDIMFKLKKPN